MHVAPVLRDQAACPRLAGPIRHLGWGPEPCIQTNKQTNKQTGGWAEALCPFRSTPPFFFFKRSRQVVRCFACLFPDVQGKQERYAAAPKKQAISGAGEGVGGASAEESSRACTLCGAVLTPRHICRRDGPSAVPEMYCAEFIFKAFKAKP